MKTTEYLQVWFHGFFVAAFIGTALFSYFLLTNDGMGYTSMQRAQMDQLTEALK